jgi:hypothetical protein
MMRRLIYRSILRTITTLFAFIGVGLSVAYGLSGDLESAGFQKAVGEGINVDVAIPTTVNVNF